MFRRIFLTLRLGIYSLLLHKLRSGLAVLGILIGIMAVIWLVAMGEGVSYQAQQQIKDLGANNIIVRSVKPSQTSSKLGNALFVPYGVLRDDYKRVITNIPVIQQAVPMREIKREVRFAQNSTEVRLVGCTPEYFDLNHLSMYRGRFIEDRDGDPADNVCVVAEQAAEKLFGFANPVGLSIQIDNDFYVVVGETERRDPTAAIGGSLDSQDYNMDVYIPLETLRVRIGDMVLTSRSGSREGEIVELSQITVSVAELDQVDQTAEIIRTLVEKYHPNEDVKVVVPKELLKQAEMLRMMFNFLLVLIAGISLVVGGIGIMNIMLATVTETDPRNRHPPRLGSHTPRDHLSVSRGGGRVDRRRRGFGCRLRIPRQTGCQWRSPVGHARVPGRHVQFAAHHPRARTPDRILVDYRLALDIDRRRVGVRPLSGAPGGHDGPDRSVASRVASAAATARTL